MWAGLIIVVIAIVIVWWLLTRNAQQSSDEIPVRDASHEAVLPEEHKIRAEMPIRTESVVQAAEVDEVIEPMPVVPAIPDIEDDLELIEGIGPKISKIFKTAGIKTFAQLAEKSPETLKEILSKAEIRLGDPTTWPEQAKLAAAGEMEALNKLQDSLRGGRKE
jgi:predicted flap endonuclease-1-like 5' DNA nuclease